MNLTAESFRRLVLLGIALGSLIARAETKVENAPRAATYRTEVSFGFGGGMRDPSRANFALTGGPAEELPGAADLAAPFDGLRNVPVSGLAWEVRSVIRGLRLTTGLAKPFSVASLRGSRGTETLEGEERNTAVRTLAFWDLRFGLGYELTFSRVTPFLDLLGDVQWLGAETTVGGLRGDFRAWAFSYTARAGLRVQLSNHVFVAASGEWGIFGPSRWGAQLLVGFSIDDGSFD